MTPFPKVALALNPYHQQPTNYTSSSSQSTSTTHTAAIAVSQHFQNLNNSSTYSNQPMSNFSSQQHQLSVPSTNTACFAASQSCQINNRYSNDSDVVYTESNLEDSRWVDSQQQLQQQLQPQQYQAQQQQQMLLDFPTSQELTLQPMRDPAAEFYANTKRTRLLDFMQSAETWNVDASILQQSLVSKTEELRSYYQVQQEKAIAFFTKIQQSLDMQKESTLAVLDSTYQQNMRQISAVSSQLHKLTATCTGLYDDVAANLEAIIMEMHSDAFENIMTSYIHQLQELTAFSTGIQANLSLDVFRMALSATAVPTIVQQVNNLVNIQGLQVNIMRSSLSELHGMQLTNERKNSVQMHRSISSVSNATYQNSNESVKNQSESQKIYNTASMGRILPNKKQQQQENTIENQQQQQQQVTKKRANSIYTNVLKNMFKPVAAAAAPTTIGQSASATNATAKRIQLTHNTSGAALLDNSSYHQHRQQRNLSQNANRQQQQQQNQPSNPRFL